MNEKLSSIDGNQLYGFKAAEDDAHSIDSRNSSCWIAILNEQRILYDSGGVGSFGPKHFYDLVHTRRIFEVAAHGLKEKHLALR